MTKKMVSDVCGIIVLFLVVCSCTVYGAVNEELFTTLALEQVKTEDPCKIELKESVCGVQVLLGGTVWLNPGRTCVRHGGKNFCTDDKTLVMDHSKPSKESRGMDGIGTFLHKAYRFKLANETLSWMVVLKSYDEPVNAIVMEQIFVDPLTNTSFPAKSSYDAGQNGLASAFPSFTVEENKDIGPRGIVRFSGIMAGSELKVEKFQKGMTTMNGLKSGPLAIFSGECAVVMSSTTSFMSSSNFYDQNSNELAFGVMGSVTEIPKHHKVGTILSASRISDHPDGIRRAFKSWGAKLLRLHDTKRGKDITTEYLQFSTDRGGYYYYQTEPDENYQDTILAVKKSADQKGIPFRQWLMDSWWYYQGVGAGVKNWTAMPRIFPDGISYVNHETNWAVVAHNRYWASNTDYAKQNGGKYDFVIEGELALPLEERFWDDLLNEARNWGLTTYEQDWLFTQFQGMNYTIQRVDTAQKWLLQMGNAAERLGINIQYCMSWPRHVLQSLEIPAVTQVRASEDYQPGNANWLIGLTSIFLDALNLVPTKDNFWSNTTTQHHGAYPMDHEPYGRLHSVVSSFSTGPVAPSDRIDALNVPLILRSCAADGTLLRPDVPAARTDKSILAEAGVLVSNRGTRFEVSMTHTKLSGFTYTYILSAVSPALKLSKEDFIDVEEPVIVWELDKPFKPLTLPVSVPATTEDNFKAYAVAPMLPNKWAFLGEAETKWVPVSKDRFDQFTVYETGFSVRVKGAPGERVKLIVQDPKTNILHIDCVITASGVSNFHTSEKPACSP